MGNWRCQAYGSRHVSRCVRNTIPTEPAVPPIRARTLALWDDIRSSYWFIPSLMTAAAALLSIVVIQVDVHVGPDWINSVSWLYGNKPDGARGVLSTIAGSMIGVAGVTFSITIASVVYASGQYGPRLLTNFMSDRGNQVTLGTFIATFLYCLLVLRTIRTGSTDVEAVAEFVPHIAVTLGLFFAVASVGVLIYFIHHVPDSIHVSNVIAGVGRDLIDHIETLFPERIGRGESTTEAIEGDDVNTDLPEHFFDEAVGVAAPRAGYIRGVDSEAMMRIASESDLILRIRRRPGDFVGAADTLLLVWPPDRSSDEAVASLQAAFALGAHRTSRQDVRFLVNELVEIAARALSPGVNDPFTANSCMDWLAAALRDLAGRDFPGAERFDESGALRVVAHPTTFDQFVSGVYGQLRPYVAADRNAALHALMTIGEVAERVSNDDQRALLRREADAIQEGTEHALVLEADRNLVRLRHATVVRLLSGSVGFAETSARTDWVGGTG